MYRKDQHALTTIAVNVCALIPCHSRDKYNQTIVTYILVAVTARLTD